MQLSPLCLCPVFLSTLITAQLLNQEPGVQVMTKEGNFFLLGEEGYCCPLCSIWKNQEKEIDDSSLKEMHSEHGRDIMSALFKWSYVPGRDIFNMI